MKYINYTAGVIFLFIILFIGSEAYKSVRQHYALIEAEELANYGPQGKPQQRIQKIKTIPNDWNIKISGAIEKGISYEIRVSYYSQSESILCRDNSLIQVSSDRTSVKLYAYQPNIDNGMHSITIPLTEHRPETGCRYRVHHVVLDLNRDDKEYNLPTTINLFYAEWALVENKLNPPGYGFTRKQLDSNLINIECVFPDPNNIHYTPSPCGLAPVQDNFAVEQKLPTFNVNYKVNINFISQDKYSSIPNKVYRR